MQALWPLAYVPVEMERTENTISFENAFYLTIPFVNVPFSRAIPPIPIVSFFSEGKNDKQTLTPFNAQCVEEIL